MNPVNSQFFSETLSNIHSLPLESLQHALGYLGSQDLVSFSSTNRYLREVVWLDARLMAPILINAPSLMPFANATCSAFWSDPAYVKKIINARHFTKVCQMIGSNTDLDYLLARACIFYSKTEPEDALTHAYRIGSPASRGYALGHIAATCNKPEILEEALSCGLLTNELGKADSIISEFISKNVSQDVHQLLKFARLISSPDMKARAFIKIAKNCDEASKNVILDEALAAAELTGNLQVSYMCDIVRISDREKAMACLNRMISITREMPHSKKRDYNFKYFSEALIPFDVPKALTLIDAIVNHQIKIGALCDVAAEILKYDYAQGMMIIRKAHAIADQKENQEMRSRDLSKMAQTVGLHAPSYAKELWEEVIQLEKIQVVRWMMRDDILRFVCTDLAPIDLEMALETAKLINYIGCYVLTITEIASMYPSKIDKNIFDEAYQKLMASDIPDDANFYFFSTYVFPHDFDLAVKAARRIIDPQTKGMALLNLAKGILPVLPLKSIELAEEGFLSFNQCSKFDGKISILENFF